MSKKQKKSVEEQSNSAGNGSLSEAVKDNACKKNALTINLNWAKEQWLSANWIALAELELSDLSTLVEREKNNLVSCRRAFSTT